MPRMYTKYRLERQQIFLKKKKNYVGTHTIINMRTRPHIVNFCQRFHRSDRVRGSARYYRNISEACSYWQLSSWFGFHPISDRLLLHELVAIQTENRKILTRRHRPGTMYSRDICVRVVEKRTSVVVRIERREQRRKGRFVRPDEEFEKSQSQVENPVGSR